MIPYTPNEETANVKRSPRSIFIKKPEAENGITDQPSKLKKSVKIGAKTKLKVLAFDGITVSLSKSFRPSAKGCSKPKNPTLLGPVRCCIAPIIFLSANVK